ncbi:MAG: hypothetical protein WAL91_10350 [Propionicimonas sp.]
MGAMAVPVSADKLDTWHAWVGELNGPRKAEFEASNARHGLTSHRAWLQTNPDGSHLVIAVHDGPGGDGYLASLAASEDPFDRWLLGSLADVHGMDPSGPLPAAAKEYL